MEKQYILAPLKMNEYVYRTFVKTIFLQVLVMTCIYTLYLFVSSFFLFLLCIPAVNLAYILYTIIRNFSWQLGTASMEEEKQETKPINRQDVAVFSDKRPVEKSAVLSEKNGVDKGGKKAKGCDRQLIGFKKHIMRRIIRPLVRRYQRYNEVAGYNDGDESFQLESSFIFDHKLQSRQKSPERKTALCQRLTKDIPEEGIRVLKKISECGWIFYQKEDPFHRLTIFFLLQNYFNFMIPSYESIYLDPFDDFIRKGPYGISFEGTLSSANFYFYSRNLSKNDNGDPITAFLYLLIYCKRHCSGMLGALSLQNFSFLDP